MAIYVTFSQPGWGGSNAAPFVGRGRASEAIADGATGALTARDGEVAIVVNTGAAVTYVAHGVTPDASATTGTSDTSARVAIPAGAFMPVACKTGDKFAAAAS